MNDTVSDWFSIMVCITAFILQNNIRAFFFTGNLVKYASGEQWTTWL